MTDDTNSTSSPAGTEGRSPRWERDLLERLAFENKSTQGIVLRANSPGGSPVQAGYINDEIKRLRAKYPKTPLYAVIGDVCASGCYYAVAAADKIYAAK